MKKILLLCAVICLNSAYIASAQKPAKKIEFSDGRIYIGQKKGPYPHGEGTMHYPQKDEYASLKNAYHIGTWQMGKLIKGKFIGTNEKGITIEMDIPHTNTKYTLPNHSSFLYIIKNQSDRLYSIIFPDSSHFEGICNTNYDIPQPQKGIFKYKNGDIFELKGDSPYQYLTGVKNHDPEGTIIFAALSPVISQKTTFEDNGDEVTLPDDRIDIPYIPILNNYASQLRYTLYKGLIESNFWETGRYPSVILGSKIDKLQQKLAANKEKEALLHEKLELLPAQTYSGQYLTEEMGTCLAEYTYKEYEGIRYKDGKIHCYTKPIKTTETSAHQNESISKRYDLTGTYKLGKRSGLWTYIEDVHTRLDVKNVHVTSDNKRGYFNKTDREYKLQGNYVDSKRDGQWTLTEHHSSWKLSKKEGDDNIHSAVNFSNGIFTGDFSYERTKYNQMYQTTSNTKVKGQFSPKGAIDGIWTVEVIEKSKDQTITSHEIITYTFDDGKLSKWEYQLPMTGTFYKYTSEKRLEYGNTSNSIKLPLWFTTRIDKPKKNQYYAISYNSNHYENHHPYTLYEYFTIWLPFASMENPNDNESICKYYAREDTMF